MRYKLASINIPVLLISFCLASITWYSITIDERTEMQLEVFLDYTNVPKNLIITGGLLDSITVNVRGPKALLKSHDPKQRHVIDLGHLLKGQNIIPFAQPGWNNKFRAFEVLHVSPAQMIVETDTLLERNVPIRPQILTTLHASAFKVQNISVSPNTALLRGPEKAIEAVDHLMLDVRVDTKAQPGTYTKSFPLITHQAQATVTPSIIAVTYTVTSQRTRINMQRRVRINGPSTNYSVSPEYINFVVEVPEALADDISYLEKAEARITPPLLEPQQQAMGKATLILPDGMTLVHPMEEAITITRLK